MSSSPQPALSRPAQAAAILRSLPSLAERLRSRGPRHRIEDLYELLEQLCALRPLIQDSTAAPALLSNAAARGALLGVLAVALRQPLPYSSIGAQGDGGGNASVELSWDLLSIAETACACCSELIICKLLPHLAARQVGFGLRLLRMQPLQCCARRLAAVGAALLSLARGGDGPQQGPQEQPCRGAASSSSAGAQLARADCLLLPKDARRAIGELIFLVQGLTCLAAHPDGEEAELAQLRQELAAALRDSCVLEHAARTLLLLLGSRSQHPDGNGDDCQHMLGLLGILDRIAGPLLSFATAEPATSEAVALAAALRGVMSGSCVQHAVLVSGVAALCAADGGPSYGLPGELLRRVPLIGPRQGRAGAVGGFDLRMVSGRQVLDVIALRNMVCALGNGGRVAPPGRHGALALLLRVGRLAGTSGRSHLAVRRESGGRAALETTVRHVHERGISTGASGCGSGNGYGNRYGSGGSGNDGGSSSSRGRGGRGLQEAQAAAGPQRSHPPSVPPLELVLDQDILQPLFSAAFEVAMALCFLAGPADRPQLAAARVECWRLYADYARGVLPLRLSRFVSASPVGYLADPRPLIPDALAGGWLPCLERLLRRGGEDPAGPELVIIYALFHEMGTAVIDCPMAWRHLAVLLAYGEPRQAAALVATLGKLLRATDPARLALAVSTAHATPAVAALWMLEGAGLQLSTVTAAASDAGDQAQGGLPCAAPSAAGRQLALMLSYALREWLPPLALLAARAMQAAVLCGTGGQQRSTAAPEGASRDDTFKTAAALLRPLLVWLPALLSQCNVAVDGAAAVRDGAAGAGSGGGSNGPDDDGCGGWRQLLLEESRFPWRPRLLLALAEALRAEGLSAGADCADALAVVLRSWEAGVGVDAGGEAASSQADAEVGAGVLLSAWQCVEYAAARCDEGVQQLAPALVSVAEARGVLRTCSHPGCVNLAGDSEAEAEAGLLGHTLFLSLTSDVFRAQLSPLELRADATAPGAETSSSSPASRRPRLCVFVKCEAEAAFARTAVGYAYTGQVAAVGIREALEVQRQAGCLHISGCAATCDELLLGMLAVAEGGGNGQAAAAATVTAAATALAGARSFPAAADELTLVPDPADDLSFAPALAVAKEALGANSQRHPQPVATHDPS
ncbi:hypothetical protein TSOC_007157 [Tetrabaena socialis]|uniref:phytol kinase n=1 Tax=Tetrabaena socialis TaxID=47790 RepID=A0A2J8A1Y4_9CHLO|nr:hypothetical protein TSOC_007157 [Tetrabaena socialis]|eukprot:PNH06515.1 hypothetical protein TSOC_007157 [Tetrabaena socialis]